MDKKTKAKKDKFKDLKMFEDLLETWLIAKREGIEGFFVGRLEIMNGDVINFTPRQLKSVFMQVKQQGKRELAKKILKEGYATANKNYIAYEVKELRKLKHKQ